MEYRIMELAANDYDTTVGEVEANPQWFDLQQYGEPHAVENPFQGLGPEVG